MLAWLSRGLGVALVGLCLLSPVPLAAEAVLSGTVQQINAPERTLTLQFGDGNTLTLTAPPGVLRDVHPGDAVEVRTAGPLVTGLTMKGAGPQVMQPSGMSPRLGFGGLWSPAGLREAVGIRHAGGQAGVSPAGPQLSADADLHISCTACASNVLAAYAPVRQVSLGTCGGAPDYSPFGEQMILHFQANWCRRRCQTVSRRSGRFALRYHGTARHAQQPSSPGTSV
jgi:hypothetical protein